MTVQLTPEYIKELLNSGREARQRQLADLEENFYPRPPEFAAPDWELWTCDDHTEFRQEGYVEDGAFGIPELRFDFPTNRPNQFKTRRAVVAGRFHCTLCSNGSKKVTPHTLWRPL